MNISRFFLVPLLCCSFHTSTQAEKPNVPPHRAKLYENWKKLKEPPITPYDGPFGPGARAYSDNELAFTRANKDKMTPEQRANMVAIYDWSHTAKQGVYDSKLDPRPINEAYEKAALEDWDRMGYNCAYKGSYFTYMVGSFLKKKGMLGAIDQTIWGQNTPGAMQFDGAAEGPKQREACGSFFEEKNFQAGVDAIFGMGYHYGHHLFTVKDHRLTCSWDEVGLRTRAQMDYRDPMRAEFRKYLKEVWFGDEAPGKDSNKDGRTYNGFTGEKRATWDEVEPFHVSLDWVKPGWDNVGQIFSKMPDVDKKLFDEPARYKLLVDFHRYWTYEFFRRINDEASKRMNAKGKPGRVSCYAFTQHFQIWPGANQRHGNSFYWYHRLSPVVNVEHMWADSPTMNLNYAITDRLSPKFKNATMAWVWFYFGQEGWDMFNGPHDIDRAMARLIGHNVDGTHHWLYSPRYRGRDQKQRLQIAYWQNFFKTHYANYLAESEPVKPQIALLMPDTTGMFYRYFAYPKQGWGWMPEAFQNLQHAYHIITEEELELHQGVLDDYKVLYVTGSEWSSATIRKRVTDFIKQGGVVYADVDSLTLDLTTGKRVDFLEKHFGTKIETKYKNAFYPSTQTAEDAMWALPFDVWGGQYRLQGHRVHALNDPRAWAKLYKRTEQKFLLDKDGQPKHPIPDNQGMKGGQPVRDPSWKMIRDKDGNLVRDEEIWKKLDKQMAAMPKEVRGLKQAPLDMRNPPQITYANGKVGTSWSEVDVAQPVAGGKVIATWDGKPVGIETENTVWMGTREGMNIHAISSRMSAHRATEPCNPFPSKIPELYESHRTYAEAVGYAADKAGVTRAVTLMNGDTLPMNLEVLPRVGADGTMMVTVINHDKTDAEYDVTVDAAYVKKGMLAWDMLREKEIEKKTDGRFDLAVPAWGVSVFMLGKPRALKSIKAAQARLNKKDMSVPKYFLDRPKLNEYEWGVPIPAIGE